MKLIVRFMYVDVGIKCSEKQTKVPFVMVALKGSAN